MRNLALALALFFTANNFVIAQTKKPFYLQQKWELSGFEAPECIILDNENAVLYVSSMNGTATDKDRNGYISRVSLDGKMIAKNWISGLNAPKGMGIYKGKLYVTDIDKIVEIDIKKGKIIHEYTVEGATFLNDIAIDKKGSVYASNTFGLSGIYKLSDDKVVLWIKDEKLDFPNGLLINNEELYLASWGDKILGKLMKVSLSNKSIQELSTPIGNLDGLVKITGGYLMSDWLAGKIVFWSAFTKETIEITDLPKGSADIELDPKSKTVFVPQMNEGKIVAYTIKK
jgi:hypothetical protein